jgi:hypothetical protein
MSASPVITVDVDHENATWISTHKLTSPNRFWAKAAATALRGLQLPLDSAITFRRQGDAIRHSSIGFLLRENAVTP